eukprot:2746957-Pleurochrysis_carterae.AAC.1
MVQNKVEVSFVDHLDMLFHEQNKAIPLDAGYGLRARPLNSAASSRRSTMASPLMSSRAARLLED